MGSVEVVASGAQRYTQRLTRGKIFIIKTGTDRHRCRINECACANTEYE